MRDVAYIAIGSNVGERDAQLARARGALAALAHSRLLAVSSVEETAPLGSVPQRPYLNQMVALETELAPRELLRELHRIEAESGRVREVRWGPRTLDLDIVMFESQTIDEDGITVPHPRLNERDFWRRELAELRESYA